MKIKLNSDVYNISKRIKEIDKYYYIVYNTSTNKFEIHNSKQVFGSYCLTLPYNTLDWRAMEYVQKTSIVNMENVLNEIQNNNNLLESTEKTSAFNKVCEHIYDNPNF